jgi:hypothetical protein
MIGTVLATLVFVTTSPERLRGGLIPAVQRVISPIDRSRLVSREGAVLSLVDRFFGEYVVGSLGPGEGVARQPASIAPCRLCRWVQAGSSREWIRADVG